MGNAIQETRFRRVDDRTRDGHATLEKDRAVLVKPGEVSLLIPDEDEIHQLDNFSDRPTVEIHVYGRDLGRPRALPLRPRHRKDRDIRARQVRQLLSGR